MAGENEQVQQEGQNLNVSDADKAAAEKAAAEKAAAGTAEGSETDASKAKGAQGDEANKVSGAPESYETFTFAEGITPDEKAVGAFQEWGKKNNLPQQAMQEVINMQNDLMVQLSAFSSKQWEDTIAGWKKTAQDDPEIGGKNFEQSLGFFKAAVKAFGTPELDEMATNWSWGDNPEMIRFGARIGKALSEGKIAVTNGGGAVEKLSTAKLLFGDLSKTQ